MHDAASRSASPTGPWTVASEVKAEEKIPSPGTGVAVGSERGSAHARREEREEHILMQRCCSGFGHTHPHSGKHQPSAASQLSLRHRRGPAGPRLTHPPRDKVSAFSLLPPSQREERGSGFQGTIPPPEPTLRREGTCQMPLASGGSGEARAGGWFGRFSAGDGFAGDAGSACAGEEPGVELGGRRGPRLCHLWQGLRSTRPSAETSLIP